ncbi:MAG: PaaI family thioesterase [Alphaproteobacteria bacterium]|jgi:uncharacterized protein (TIGR00369 family)|nr:PaaI family thioesterase [Alphaproteobacteria bacterium]MDP6567184.1 PaaI family thioesterase [Alphaproteobacteria bacterium]MDP6814839.1 PaaI family thioesterase [Alphaproteobacteria bacterium]
MNVATDERREKFEKRILGPGFGAVLGAKLTHLADGHCRLLLPWRSDLSRGDALVHGGVIAALIDKAGTAAAWSYPDLDRLSRGATVAMNVNFLEGAAECDLLAEARVVRRGGSLSVVDIDVSNPDGALVAKGMVTYKISRPRS